MTTERMPLEQRAALDLANRGRAGALTYVAIWLIVIPTTDVLAISPALVWFGIVGLAALGVMRLVLGLGFERLYPKSPTGWLAAYALSSIGLGLVWGGLNALLLHLAPFEWTSMLSSFATTGIVAGGIVSLATHNRIARVYVVAMLLPSALVCFALANPQGTALGVLFVLDILFMIVVNRQASGEYWTALRNTELLEQRAAQLEAARAIAEAADRAKSRFVATMSHEIRTPLNGVFGMIDLLRHGVAPDEQARYLGVMERSAHSLLSVINDILDFSKIEAGMLTLERTEYRPSAVVAEVRELFLGAAEEKGLEFIAETTEADAYTVLGDPTRLRQVLWNLVANAVKFTDAGRVVVTARRLRLADDSVDLRFCVSDTGIGMAPDVAVRVFDAFEQADASTTRRHGGTGLGLAIGRQLVEMMGGELTVDSKPGRGSAFAFELRLPRVQIGVTAAVELAQKPCAPRFDGLRVLVVEDNLVNQFVAQEVLASLGCEAAVAENGLAALDALATRSFDLVLMDCQMPELDGLETTRCWRARERELGLAPLPVIALTANAGEDDRRGALAAGMNDFLTKPFTAAELASAILATRRARETPSRVVDLACRLG